MNITAPEMMASELVLRSWPQGGVPSPPLRTLCPAVCPSITPCDPHELTGAIFAATSTEDTWHLRR